MLTLLGRQMRDQTLPGKTVGWIRFFCTGNEKDMDFDFSNGGAICRRLNIM